MDWNSTKTGNVIMAATLLVGMAMLGYMVWSRQYPDPAKAPSLEGATVVSGYGWGPPIFLAICLAVTLGIWLRVHRKTATSTKASNVQGIETALTKCQDDLARLMFEAQAARMEAGNANKRASDETKRAIEEANQKNEIYRQFQSKERFIGQWAWLWNMAQEQSRDLSEHVIAATATLESTSLIDSPRGVTVAINIRNESLFDITVQTENITGTLVYERQDLKSPITASIFEGRPTTETLKPMQIAKLTLWQPLIQWEVEFITDARSKGPSRFWLGRLRIPLSVENVTPRVDPKDLRICAEIEFVSLGDF